ncbi:hypothetical protein GIB67_025570 [Kingdonia uniflora]|uniref:Uncharacterized protein n=1 Tax=Kingdonia uniflora TaxID=39325 RepID=A0A7J7M0E9_9MAGN|nr:hypothetical protein GIB67_025570 [Kingdonia uniflora]
MEKEEEPESNVLLASIENLQYAVTVDVLHTVLTILGILGIWYCPKNCYIWKKKNGGMQTLVQYPGTIIVCYILISYYVLLVLL